jgi:anion-transporting  ArsA/GET3 family ATPase
MTHPAAPQFDAGALLDDPATRIVVTCGSGGVGKTTTAAAMAVRAADAGRTVAVLTIDPARRLAQSLGLAELDNTPRRVDLGAQARGELWAMMLDTRRTFDDMVSAHTSPERAAQIMANPFYRSISSSFSGTQEYMAMEKLGQLAATGTYDLIVVDTPPSRSALDFLDAPQRLAAFLDGRMIRLLAAPSRGVMKLVGVGFTLFAKAVTAVIGGQMLTDAARFVQLFEDMFGGFRARAETTYALLRDPGSSFVVVATCQADALREAAYFADRLLSEHMPLAGLVLNRTHPPLVELPPKLDASALESAVADTSRAKARVLARAALQLHAAQVALHVEELRMRARFEGARPEVGVISVPALPTDVHDLSGLRALAAVLAP